MNNKCLALILATPALAGTAWPDVAAHLSIDAAPAVAAIQPLPDERTPAGLPSLEFEFSIHASCGPDQLAASVSISVADTRRTLAGEQLRGDGPIAAAIRLPAWQLSPVAVGDFCNATSADAGGDRVLIRDVATAHLSLRCTGETGESITYASKSLDVTLVCETPPYNQGDASTATDR